MRSLPSAPPVSSFRASRARGSRALRYALHGLLALLAAGVATLLAASDWPALQYLNSKGIDACFLLAGQTTPAQVRVLPQASKIYVIDLPHEVPRGIMARLVTKLKQARVVGIDVMFPDRKRDLSPEEIDLQDDREKRLYAGEVARWDRENAELARAIQDAGNVVIGAWPDRTYIDDGKGHRQTKVVWNYPVASFWEAARWKAALRVEPDPQDGTVRRVLLWNRPDQLGAAPGGSTARALPAFGLCLAAAALGQTPEAVSRRMALMGPQEMLIDYLGPRNCFEGNDISTSYDQVLYNDPSEYKDQIVLIGETSYTNKDTFPTPYDDQPGLFIHANVAATLLSPQGAPAPLSPWAVVGMSFAASFILMLPLLRRKPMWRCLPLALGEIVVVVALMVCIWNRFHAVLPLSAPLVALFLTYNGVTLYEYWRARGVLHDVVGSQGIGQLLDALDKPELGGKTEIATAFFCDLRGYTTLAQHLPGEALLPLLNIYTDAVVQEIMRYGGRPIDYFGDGVFAIFEGHEQAARALRAALGAPEAVRVRFLELKPLVQEWPELESAAQSPPQMGIALNTGPMIIGLVGSLRRPKPGAVGDTVNVAARVQGLTGTYGLPVLMTRATLDALGDWNENEAPIRFCGEHLLKGRDEVVEVFGAEIVGSPPPRQVPVAAESLDTGAKM